MRAPTYSDAFQVLLLQLADEGRGELLLGESLDRARAATLPFLVGNRFPDAYLEFPLAGDPFLDVTLLYSDIAPGMRVDSPAAGDNGALFDWFAAAHAEHDEISMGFELDTKEPVLPAAAMHFQPRSQTHLVEPFCQAIGEPDRARTYLDQAQRMPEEWALSFFGLFRGRPDSPLRVCGYLSDECKLACAADWARVAEAFDAIGFTAYDDAMLQQVSQLFATAPGTVDFQFDVYPDGRLSDVFAVDVQFEIEQPNLVRDSFSSGRVYRVMKLFEEWGIVDERWKSAAGAAFARSLPVELEDGMMGLYAFTLMPQWVKARWRAGVLQPAKLYFLGNAGLLGSDSGGTA